MAWGARQLIQHGRLRVFPQQSALALTQNLWTALVTFGHTGAVALRLSNFPMVIAATILVYLVARRLGATRFWSTVGAATLVVSPLYGNLAATYMTEPVYLALLAGVAYCAVRWRDGHRWRAAFVGLAVLATLQRQIGLMVAFAALLTLISHRRESSRADVVWAAAAIVAVVAAASLPVLFHYAPPTEANRVDAISHLDLFRQVEPLYLLGLELGFIFIPFGIPLLLTKRSSGRFGLGALLALIVGLAGLYGMVRHLNLFPLTTIKPHGFAVDLDGPKPDVFSPVFVALCAGLLLLTMEALFVWRADWSSTRNRFEESFLLMLCVTQFVPLLLLNTQAYDRYYLGVALPGIPLLALLLSRSRLEQRRAVTAQVFALLGLTVCLFMLIAGEQDYLAWEFARDQAARQAYQFFPPQQVDGGYEANAVYVDVPAYDRTGSIKDGLATGYGDYGSVMYGPPHPKIRLEFAPAWDPRPGVVYHSLGTGKVILDFYPPAVR